MSLMSSEQSFSFQWLSPLEIPLANKFYKTIKVGRKVRRNELCAVMRADNNRIIASAYVREYQTFKLLAGVAVSSFFQRQRVASRLLSDMTNKFDQNTYTFPYEHLISLYQSVGFSSISTEQSPSAVAELCRKYRHQGRGISIMVYAGKALSVRT